MMLWKTFRTYLGSKITTDGDSAKDAMDRIRKASQTFAMLKLETKLRLYNSNVLNVLLYGSECWKLTAKLAHKHETFQNRCLRKILGVFWPNTITNEELLCKTDATSLATQIKEDGDGLDTCAEYHLAHCPRQPYAGQQMVKGDVVAQKKHGDEQWRR